MNKNLKRALNTTAAVSMSLAMVLGAVAPTTVNASVLGDVCENTDFANSSLSGLLTKVLDEDFTMKDLEDLVFDKDGNIATNSDTTNGNIAELFVGNDENVELLKTAKKCASTDEEEKLDYLYDAVYHYVTFKDVTKSSLPFGGEVDLDEYNVIMENLTGLETLYETYYSNLTNTERDRIYENLVEIQDAVEEAGLDMTDAFRSYIKNIKTAIEEFIEDEIEKDSSDYRKSITKAELTQFIKDIKNDEIVLNDGTTVIGYKNFKDREEFVEIMDEFDVWYDEIALVTAAVNRTKNETYKEFLAVQKAADKEGRNYKGENVVDELTMADYEVYKAFKADVVDAVYTMEAEKFASKYYDESEKSHFVTLKELEAVRKDFNAGAGLPGDDYVANYLTTLQDDETGEFGWDILVAHMEAVIENYKLVSEDLEKLVAKGVTVNDKDLILAIDDAYDFLTRSGWDNLTGSEQKVVRRAERTINELYEAYRKDYGTLGKTTGWVDMGNGNWKFYEADGTVMTRWLADNKGNWYWLIDGNMARNYWVPTNAGWYYVGDDGVMVSNVTLTLNGINYTFDADGIWVR